MGLFLSRLSELFSARQKPCRALMVGLDAAGKTTILYKLKLGDVVTTIPTIGFNVEHVSYKNIEFTVWDIGGQDKIRQLWRHYYTDTDLVIFVVDSCDSARFDIASEELHKLMTEQELKDAIVLVYANKQDAPGALSPKEVSDQLRLHDYRARTWFIQPSSGKTGDGLFEGLDWAAETLAKVSKK
eukprot:GDKI01025771.1.p1 GENE.GDKI01025771.1~~GDKI01025771.1.p1  ORF type:complete len:185 (-),score=39.72 GDKI01025771.1:27-581(-)